MTPIPLQENGESEKIGRTRVKGVQVTRDDGTAFPAQVHTGVNAVTDPKLRLEVLRGTLHDVEGPDDDESFHLSVPFYYHNPEVEMFVLVVPRELRHLERDYRRHLTEQIREAYDGSPPAYLEQFPSVFRLDELRQMELDKMTDFDEDELEVTKVGPAPTADKSDDLAAQVRRLKREWEGLEQKWEALTLESEVKQEVDERIVGHIAPLDRALGDLQKTGPLDEHDKTQIRRMTERSRQALRAETLRYEQHKRWEEDFGEMPVEETKLVQTGSLEASPESREFDGGGRDSQTVDVFQFEIEPANSTVEPGDLAGDAERFLLPGDGDPPQTRPKAVARCSESTARKLVETTEPSFRVTLVESRDEQAAIVGLTLASGSDEQAALIAWGLHPSLDSHDKVLDALVERTSIQVVLVERESGDKKGALTITGPYEETFRALDEHLAQTETDADRARQLVETFESAPESHLPSALGAIEETFSDTESFEGIRRATKLVAYLAEQSRVALAGRSISLNRFEEAKRRTLSRAVRVGVVVPSALRDEAIEVIGVDSEKALFELTLANFVDTTLDLNDSLESSVTQRRDNWFDLFDWARSLDCQVSPEVLELADDADQQREGVEQ